MFNALAHAFIVGIEPLKARYDVIKLDLTIPLLSFWCTDINLSIQPMSLTLYMMLAQGFS